ncbi:leucine-rich repeats and immunoglobulin-like domains protein 2 [Haliotis rufescens]|uniref:leucine-rich repeats and immunoglobulin-like domains protein 2 n=1 Tax=Haliotis rufescens TaxID=6454 RepID=UPI001EB03157|nr:leucine-rich repeats and immunoglobulin-like domains protein 2 [Haliotis rufescens]
MDMARFICRVAFITTVLSDHLDIIITPTRAPIRIIERDQAEVSCKLKGGNSSLSLKYRWFIGNHIVGQKSSILLTADRHMFDEGNLTCAVLDTSDVKYGSATVAVSVQYPPEVFSERRHAVFRGEDASICQDVSGHPTPDDLKWKRVGVKSPWITSHCRIRQVNESHAGEYLFVMNNTMADNIRYETRKGRGVQLVNLVVLYGARAICPSNYTAVVNTTAVLACEVDASPAAHITWSRAGGPAALPQTGSYLRMPRVQVSDAGDYTCSASNTIREYTGRVYTMNDSCTIRLIVRGNLSEAVTADAPSVLVIYKTHFIAASVGIVVLALVVVLVVVYVRRRSKLQDNSEPVRVDGDNGSYMHSTYTGGGKPHAHNYDVTSAGNQTQHYYRQVHRDAEGYYGNVETADPQDYVNYHPEEHTDASYPGNVTVQERRNEFYYGNVDETDIYQNV